MTRTRESAGLAGAIQIEREKTQPPALAVGANATHETQLLASNEKRICFHGGLNGAV